MDFAVPVDLRLEIKEKGEKDKYLDLARELNVGDVARCVRCIKQNFGVPRK